MASRTPEGGFIVVHIESDREACQGYANCVMGAPAYFDLDDDGKVVLLRAEVEPEQDADVDAAVRSCPVDALRMVRE